MVVVTQWEVCISHPQGRSDCLRESSGAGIWVARWTSSSFSWNMVFNLKERLTVREMWLFKLGYLADIFLKIKNWAHHLRKITHSVSANDKIKAFNRKFEFGETLENCVWHSELVDFRNTFQVGWTVIQASGTFCYYVVTCVSTWKIPVTHSTRVFPRANAWFRKSLHE